MTLCDQTTLVDSVTLCDQTTLVDTATLTSTATTVTDGAKSANQLTDATWTDARAGYIDELGSTNLPADVDAILVDTTALDTLTKAAGDGDLAAIKVDTDTLNDAQTELSDISTSTGTPLEKISSIHALLRNKDTLNKTTGVETLYKEDGSSTLATATHTDDDTTFTRGEKN